MLHRSRSRDAVNNGLVTSHASRRQMTDYLQDVRNNRPSRPQGSRPLPSSSKRTSYNLDSQAENRLSISSELDAREQPSRSSSAMSHHRPRQSLSGRTSPDKFTYAERDDRRREREEARLVRMAMESRQEEPGVTKAAQNEADHLIWKHRYPNAPYHVSRGSRSSMTGRTRYSLERPIDYADIVDQYRDSVDSTRQSLDVLSLANHGDVLDSEQQSQSLEQLEAEMSQIAPINSSQEGSESQSKAGRRLSQKLSISRLSSRRRSIPALRKSSAGQKQMFPNEQESIYEDPSPPATQAGSGQPKDQSTEPSWMRRNPFAKAQNLRQSLTRKSSLISAKPVDAPSRQGSSTPVPPSSATVTSRTKEDLQSTQESSDNQEVKFKNGIEVRSDDIRAATSMKRGDRSPRLPSPTVVSDNPGRPIVSFRSDWQPSEKELAEQGPPRPNSRSSPVPGMLTKAATEPVIPTVQRPSSSRIQVSTTSGWRNDRPSSPRAPPLSSKETPAIPSINVSSAPSQHRQRPSIPTINFPDTPSIAVSEPEPSRRPSAPAIPTISIGDSTPKPSIPSINLPSDQPRHRPQPTHTHSTPAALPTSSRGPWPSTSSSRRSLLCAQCALPITGRVVSAAGTRFHPSCFTCHTCAAPLECMAFLPEPAAQRSARLERISRRSAGEPVPAPPNTIDDDNDDSLRFYCQLDYHEAFSPRCKHCKTPIEGEVVVACGASWHAGHFFCAQCGDPFDPSIPFVERDGYAWCVTCHTNRTATRCAACKKPVVDTVVAALGAEWHEACFRCSECTGPFNEGRYFLRPGKNGNLPVCVSCEERRLKA